MQVYFVPHVKALPEGVRSADLGAYWLAQHQNEGTPFVLVSFRDHAKSNDTIKQLTSGGIPWAIPKNFPPQGWPGGPVLAPWANNKVTECIDRYSDRITSVCVLKWVETDAAAWLVARGAIDVTAPERVPQAPTIDDGVVLAAMKEITGLVDFGKRLGEDWGRTDAVRRLQYLKRWKRDLDAEQITAWALANGWSQCSTDLLRRTVIQVNEGYRFRKLRMGPIKDGGALLRKWEQQQDDR